MNAWPHRFAETPVVPDKPPDHPQMAGWPPLEFRLLGPLEVRRGDELVVLGGARQRALLALLCLRRGTVLAVDRIVDELWGESPPHTARHMVEVYVSKLRKILGAEILVTRPPGYLLQVDQEQVDVARFERLLAEGRDALAAGKAALAASKLADGLLLWRGPPLADFAYEPFAQAEISRLEESLLLAEEERIDAELAVGKSAELVAELEDLVARAPFRERFRAQLMLALYRSGRQADALAAYRAGRETLVEELGVEPSPELRELERAILAQDESLIGAAGLDRPRPAARETRRVVTIVFVEPAVGEVERDPEALLPVLERSLECAEEVLQRHGASVERVPDGTVMAVFGSPVAHEDDAVRSLRAVRELRELGVVSRAAVETGEVLAGGDLAVRGRVVRTAAELLAFASPSEVLVGELTHRLTAGSAGFEATDLDRAPAWRLVDVERHGPPRPLLLDTPLVGRRKELAELRDALARAAHERRPELVVIIGEAGIGKSRLAREFAERASLEARVLTGRCLAYGDGITYWPLREILSELAPAETLDELNALVAGLPDGKRIARRLAATVGLVEDVYPVEEIRWAARRLFEQLARDRPLIVVLEDVHWAERTFLDLVEHVVALSKDASILIVCLARPELLDEHPGWEGRGGRHLILTLEALSDAESVAFIARRHPAGAMPPDQRARILDAADGNPLFLQQLLAFTADQTSQITGLDVPPTLQTLLAARLDLLGPGERAAVECAAVVGREFSADSVAELVPSEARTTLLRHLEALQRKEFLEPERSTAPFERAFRFRHALIQGAAYRSLPKGRRAELHECLAGWLERAADASGGEQDEIVGYHLEQAYAGRIELGLGDDSSRKVAVRAGEKLSAAGERALARNDLPAAVNLLTRATSLSQAGGRPRVDLLVDLGAALFPLGEGPKSLAVLDEALEAAQAAGNAALEWSARLERNYVLSLLEPGALSIVEKLRAAEQAIEALSGLGDQRALARAWRSVTQCRAWLGKFSSSLEASERAIKYARQTANRQGEIWTLRTRLMALWSGPMPAAEAARACEEILAAAENQEVVACALENLGGLRAKQGRLEEARSLTDRAIGIYRELGLTLRLASSIGFHRSEVYILRGDPAGAKEDLRTASQLLASIGEKSSRSTVTASLASTLYALGRYSEAERQVELTEQLAGIDDWTSLALLSSVRAKLLSRRGQLHEAKAVAEKAVSMAEGTDDLDTRGALWMDKAEVHELAGEPDVAVSCVERAIDLFDQKGNVVLAGRARIKLAELTATAGAAS